MICLCLGSGVIRVCRFLGFYSGYEIVRKPCGWCRSEAKTQSEKAGESV